MIPPMTDDEDDSQRNSYLSQGFMEAQNKHLQSKKSRQAADGFKYDNPFQKEKKLNH